MKAASRVAAPKKIGSIPVASGSKLPAWPALAAAKSRLARCNARFDDSPNGLSSSSSPNTSRLGGRASATVGSVGIGLGTTHVVDELAELDGAFGARVVAKAQVGRAPQLQRLGHARAEKSARLLERFLDRQGIVFEAERVEEHGRKAQVARDLDLADAC